MYILTKFDVPFTHVSWLCSVYCISSLNWTSIGVVVATIVW